jgi:GR25 family glycosyltransferase involved in LPS biosynthesis
MKANVINLNYRKDRLKEIQAECSREGLQLVRHEGVNGQKVFFDSFKNKRMRGQAGCWQSHVNLLNKVKGTSEWHLVLEDDEILCDGFKSKVEFYVSKLPTDCGLVYFGGTLNQGEPIEPYNDLFNQAKYVLGTHCYLIKDTHIDKMLEVLNTRIYKVDVLFTEYQNKYLTLISKECLAWQRPSYSDITFINTNYNTKY